MNLTSPQITDLYVALKAKALETGEQQNAILFYNEDWGERDVDEEIRGIAYSYRANIKGQLSCDLIVEYRDKKTQEIIQKTISDTEFMAESEIPKITFTKFEYNKIAFISFKKFSKEIGISLVTVSSKLPLNLKYHFEEMAKREGRTVSEVIRAVIEKYVEEQLSLKVKELMYQKPADLF